MKFYMAQTTERINENINPYPQRGGGGALWDHKGVNLTPLKPDQHISDTLLSAIYYFVDLVREKRFPCIGAKQTIEKHGTFAMGEYGDMTSPETAEAISHDIFDFLKVARPEEMDNGGNLKPSSFSAYFSGTSFDNELEACRKILILIKNITDLDRLHFPIPTQPVKFSRQIDDPNFAVCVAGHPFFTAFFHPHREDSSPRKTDGKIFVNFNSHHGFYFLKNNGNHEQWLDIIRKNIKNGYGEPHPDLVHHGLWSEVMQYLTVSNANRQAAIQLIAAIFDLPNESELFTKLEEMRAVVKERAIAAGCPYHIK